MTKKRLWFFTSVPNRVHSMANTTKTRSRLIWVCSSCPKCGVEHKFILEIESESSTIQRPALIICGPADPEAERQRHEHQARLKCPNTGQEFTEFVQVDLHDEVISSIKQIEEGALVEVPQSTSNVHNENEWRDWVQGSAQAGHEFAKAMLNSCLSAIPILLAVLTLAMDRGPVSKFAVVLTILAIILFLISAFSFALAQLPQKSRPVDLFSFIDFREKVLNRTLKISNIGFYMMMTATIFGSFGVVFQLLES